MTQSYNDVGALDLLLLTLRAAEVFLDDHGAADLAEDAAVEVDEQDEGDELGDDGLEDKVVVDDVRLVGADQGRAERRLVGVAHDLETERQKKLGLRKIYLVRIRRISGQIESG